MLDPSFFLWYLLPKYQKDLRDCILYFGSFGSNPQSPPQPKKSANGPWEKLALHWGPQFSVYFSSPPQPLKAWPVSLFPGSGLLSGSRWTPSPGAPQGGLPSLSTPRNSSSFSPSRSHPCISCLSKYDLKKKHLSRFCSYYKGNIGLPWPTRAHVARLRSIARLHIARLRSKHISNFSHN